VRKLSQWLDVPAGQIATIGDMPNDVLMFALSGLSIAMGNASREVQRAARRVTTSNEEEGFANAIECFILCERDAALAGVPHASLDRSEGEHHDSSRSGDSQLVRQG
jgi:3-deoxy-D-manno-octulosonate 8-phosphate phosphatase KdsC-like HAD superfamily phosphatase